MQILFDPIIQTKSAKTHVLNTAQLKDMRVTLQSMNINETNFRNFIFLV